MKANFNVKSAQSLHESPTYLWAKRGVFFGTALAQSSHASSASLVTVAAYAVMEASRAAVDRVAPQTLTKYSFVKLSVTAALSSIAAVALLVLLGTPLTLSVLGETAAMIAAPSVAEWILELAVVFIRNQNTMGKALEYLKSSNPLDQARGFVMAEKLAKKNVKDAHYLMYICYKVGRGVQKSKPEAIAWAKKGEKSGCLKCKATSSWHILKEEANHTPGEVNDARRALNYAVEKKCLLAYSLLADLKNETGLNAIEAKHCLQAARNKNAFAASILFERYSASGTLTHDQAMALTMKKIAAGEGSLKMLSALIEYYRDSSSNRNNAALAKQWKNRRAEVIRSGESQWLMLLSTL